MCADKSRRTTARIDIPRAANIQACAVGRGQRAVHDMPDAVFRLLRFHHVVLLRVQEQRLSRPLPIARTKTEPQKKSRFAAPAGCAELSRYCVIFRSGTVANWASGNFIQACPLRI